MKNIRVLLSIIVLVFVLTAIASEGKKGRFDHASKPIETNKRLIRWWGKQ